MAKFGGADRGFVSKEAHKLYKLFCDKEEIFPQYKDLFHFAAALGIRLGKRKEGKKEVQLLRITTIDPDGIFETILEEIHPDADGRGRLKLLREYAEAGIQILKDRYDNEKKIDLEEIIEEMQS